MRLSEKLAGLCAAAAFLPFLIGSIAVLNLFTNRSDERARDLVQSSAKAAESIYQKRLDQMRSAVQRLSAEIANKAVVSGSGDERERGIAWRRLQDLLVQAQNEMSLDFLLVTDHQGAVLVRHNDRPEAGETVMAEGGRNPVAERVIADGIALRVAPLAAAVVEPREQLARLGLGGLALEAGAETVIDEALMIEAGAPIFLTNRFIGVVLIGQMLNTYYVDRKGIHPLQTPIVAEVRNALFPGPEKSAGGLIAFHDRIVASSLPAPEVGGGRPAAPALAGRRCDPARSQEPIESDGTSYLAGWQPIKSLDGASVGAVGVAIRREDLTEGSGGAIVALFAAGLAGSAAAGAAGFFFGSFLAGRIRSLGNAATRMALGELGSSVKETGGTETSAWIAFLRQDEVNRLSGDLDLMRESFRKALERQKKR